jgi:hypothetical protein
MTRPEISPQKLQDSRELAAGWGKILARRAFGEAGPGLDIDIHAMEQLAAAAATGLTEGTFAALLEQQAQHLGAAQPCPDCGHLCPLGHEDRPLAGQGGRLTYHAPVCHCPAGRRDSFPPAPGAPPRRP